MIIRELQTADLPALSALAATTYTETFGHSLTPEELQTHLQETMSETYFRTAMNHDTFLVAILAGHLAGYLQLGDIKFAPQGVAPGPNDQGINAIYIHSAYQRQGLGRALMNAAFEHPRLANADNIFLDVWEENKRALTFYLKQGFEIVGTCDVVIGGKVVGSDLVLRRPARKRSRHEDQSATRK
jgi:ribosomal protein S18 acetylase RimI-like enzyme